MNEYLAYIRVSTVKQGERGVSLQEQRAAIERFASRHNFTISRWFEEKETAAKRGRPAFSKIMRLLKQNKADGVIMHKIDRGSRNLKDWADLGELIDQGIKVHFANESLDLQSRGGRLAADIQAVVAADYIRNLKEETKKGIYGRLKQGILPWAAPLGYLDQGSGKLKTIDPVRGPYIKLAFELYATGNWSLRSLNAHLYERGLRGRTGQRLSINSLSLVLRNPFYTGLIRVKKTGETFQGKHEPLIPTRLFQEVQDQLDGKKQPMQHRHSYAFNRLFKCLTCGYTLVGERQKGHVYYRCHRKECPTTSIREDRLEESLCRYLKDIAFSPEEWEWIEEALEEHQEEQRLASGNLEGAAQLKIGQIEFKLRRLTDTYLCGDLERELFLEKKEELLTQQRMLSEQLEAQADDPTTTDLARTFLELAKNPSLSLQTANTPEKRELLSLYFSNRTLNRKKPCVELSWPFDLIAKRDSVLPGWGERDEVRTIVAKSTHLPLRDTCRILVQVLLEGIEDSVSGRSDM